MYLPASFSESRPELLRGLMEAYPLATLVTLSTGGLTANHVPLEYDTQPGPLGTLRGHIARANPLWRESAGPSTALAVFHGPSAYISPNWYPTKRDTGEVVPTWNYAVVHAHGALEFIDDRDWLLALVTRLTDVHESTELHPWAVTDAPAAFIDQLLGAIIGFELRITRLEGKWKMTQNRPESDRAGIVAGLESRDRGADRAVAGLVDSSREKF